MEQNPGTARRAHRVRALNVPQPVSVEVDATGMPVALEHRGRKPVISVLARWRIDDEWWRDMPVSRLYFELVLEDGATITVFRDLVSDAWYRQRYG